MKKAKCLKRLWTGVLAAAMIVAMVPNMGATQAEAAGFTPRLSAPSGSEPYYSSLNPFSNGGGTGNCTWYAYGRAYEILGSEPDLPLKNAVYFWYETGYPKDQTPQLGDIAVWDGEEGHVAVVEKIEGNKITTSQSAWGGPYFDTSEWDLSNMGYYSTYLGYRRNFLGFVHIRNTEPIGWEQLNLGDSFRAQIIHDNGWYIKDRDCNIVCETGSSSDRSSWWEFTRNANGSYRIKNCQNWRYIDDYGAGSSNGNNIVSWEGNGTGAQNWFIKRAPNGKVLFESECATRMTMDMGGDPTANGADVHLWVWSDDNTNQWFTLKYDKEKPVIKNVKVTEVTKNGYKVECDVSDNMGIAYVEMPTWTTYNGQDDLAKNWPKATVSNGHATFYVSAADHNNETGTYITHIYAYDYAGQFSSVSAGDIKVSACDPHAWDDGKVTKEATCTENGEKTYTCAACGEKKTETIKALGHEFDEGKVTKEATRYEDGVRTFTCVHGCGETKTEAIPADSIKWAEKISLSDTELTVESGKTANLQVTVSPEDAVLTDVIWTSSNEEVATVDEAGTITAVNPGETVIKAAAADSVAPTTEYRYRTVESYETKTTQTKGSLGEGWEYVSEKKDTVYGSWGTWSDWSRTEYQKSDTRDVESRYVPEYKTQYNYSKYAQYSSGGGWSGPYEGYWSGIYCGYRIDRGWSDSPLSAYDSDGSIVLFGRSGDTWYNQTTQQVQCGGHYEYRHRDRSKTEVITYTYRRPVWGEWSSWSATPVEAADGKEIETRQVEGAGEATVTAECRVTVVPVKKAGWYTDESGYVFCYNKQGEKQTGWFKIKSYWYYCDAATGRATGLKQINGKTYYFSSKGVMKTGWYKKSGKWYYFGTNGAMVTGWKKIGGSYYRFTAKGVMQTGWTKYKGNWYYLKSDGKMAQNCSIAFGPTIYNFDTNGICTNP